MLYKGEEKGKKSFSLSILWGWQIEWDGGGEGIFNTFDPPDDELILAVELIAHGVTWPLSHLYPSKVLVLMISSRP